MLIPSKTTVIDFDLFIMIIDGDYWYNLGNLYDCELENTLFHFSKVVLRIHSFTLSK